MRLYERPEPGSSCALRRQVCESKHWTGCWVHLLLNPTGSANQNTWIFFFFSGSVAASCVFLIRHPVQTFWLLDRRVRFLRSSSPSSMWSSVCLSDAAGASPGSADGNPAGCCRAGTAPGSGLEDPPGRLKVPHRHPKHQRSRCRGQQRQPR